MRRGNGFRREGHALLAVVLSGLLACSTSEGDNLGQQPQDAVSEPEGSASSAGSFDLDAGGFGDGEVGLPAPQLSDFPASCETDGDCEGQSMCLLSTGMELGICILAPGAPTSITDPLAEENTDMLPELACVGESNVVASGELVSMVGVVDRFGSGPTTEGMKVRVYSAAGFVPTECDGLEPADRQECYDALLNDGSILIGEAIATAAPEQTEVIGCEVNSECPMGFACAGTKGFEECEAAHGFYQVDGVPTGLPLVIAVTATADQEDWHKSFHFNVVVDEQFVAGGSYRFDPVAVAHGQWITVQTPCGVSVQLGNGAVGGRVRDCGGERRGWYINEATIALANPASGICYFNDKETDSLPDPGRSSTNILGRFAALDVPPGPNWITGAVNLEGETTGLGAYPLYVFPNSLSIVSFPGAVAPITQE